jgi:GAF domain-containing protein
VTDYQLLTAQLQALIEGESDLTANLANAAALLNSALPDLNWVGFYLVKPAVGAPKADEAGNHLVLGPFQGLPACIRLPYGAGVCGTAWQTNQSLRVADVHAFPGHIACDSASQSEVVIPLRYPDGRVWGVLDLDSPRIGRFTEADQAGLEAFCRALESAVKPV